jgi:para-aminobenzoate synthetase / 4-amino-4-deoxychorismate lyase
LHFKIENGKTLDLSKDFFAVFPRPVNNTVLIFSDFIEERHLSVYEKAFKSHSKIFLLDFENKHRRVAFFATVTVLPYQDFLNLLLADINMPSCFDFENLNVNAQAYQAGVQSIKDEIVNGNVYQVNLTFLHELALPAELPLFNVWLKLFSKQVSNHTSFISIPGTKVASVSPELFFSIKNDTIVSEPMKGTAGVSESQIKIMQSSLKEKAENAMITDMIRNDIAKISEFGSVKVTKPFFTSSFQTISQMSTQVKGSLRPQVDLYEIFDALHPPGSVTGAPKIASLELIKALEKEERELYTGTVGYQLPGGRAQFNVCIRTVTQSKDNTVKYGSGAGITIDSDPRAEFKEMLNKVNVLFDSKEILALETFRCSNKKIYWLENHLSRLSISYQTLFQRPLPTDLRDRLIDFAQRIPEKRGILRLRVAPGVFNLKWSAYHRESEPAKLSIANSSLSSKWKWLKVKSTRRKLYLIYQYLATKNGLTDYLFCNEEGYICEGAISNIIVKKGNYYATPPTKDGLLNGVFRSKLLERFPKIFKEEQITMAEMFKATEWYICNAARGVRRGHLK